METLLETLSLIIQYIGVSAFVVGLTEVVKDPIKDYLPIYYKHVLALVAGVLGLVLGGLAFGWDPTILSENFIVGLTASGLYRIAKK